MVSASHLRLLVWEGFFLNRMMPLPATHRTTPMKSPPNVKGAARMENSMTMTGPVLLFLVLLIDMRRVPVDIRIAMNIGIKKKYEGPIMTLLLLVLDAPKPKSPPAANARLDMRYSTLPADDITSAMDLRFTISFYKKSYSL